MIGIRPRVKFNNWRRKIKYEKRQAMLEEFCDGSVVT